MAPLGSGLAPHVTGGVAPCSTPSLTAQLPGLSQSPQAPYSHGLSSPELSEVPAWGGTSPERILGFCPQDCEMINFRWPAVLFWWPQDSDTSSTVTTMSFLEHGPPALW